MSNRKRHQKRRKMMAYTKGQDTAREKRRQESKRMIREGERTTVIEEGRTEERKC